MKSCCAERFSFKTERRPESIYLKPESSVNHKVINIDHKRVSVSRRCIVIICCQVVETKVHGHCDAMCVFSPGILRTAVPDMDRETQDQYLVVLQAKDMGGHLGGLSGTTTVTVRLTDVNDNPPRFTQSE